MIDIVHGRDNPENLTILKRRVGRSTVELHSLVFWDLIKSYKFGSPPAEILNTPRCITDQHGLFRIGFYNLCLSPRVTKCYSHSYRLYLYCYCCY